MFAESVPLGLSFGDRACLAAVIDRGEPGVTADRVWSDLDVSADVVVIR